MSSNSELDQTYPTNEMLLERNRFQQFFDETSIMITQKINEIKFLMEKNNTNTLNRQKLNLNNDPIFLNPNEDLGLDIEMLKCLNSEEYFPIHNLFTKDNDEKGKNLNIILNYIYNNRNLGKDFFSLNEKLIQTALYLKNIDSTIKKYLNVFENFGSLMKDSIFPLLKIAEKNYDNDEENKLDYYYFPEEEKKIINHNPIQFLKKKRKKANVELEQECQQKGLHYRPKRDYELKKRRIAKPKVFKIEKIFKNRRMSLRKGSKKYILKRIQYCWKSYFVKLILKIIPKRYDVVISKKFYQDHTKAFYIQLFNRLNTVKQLIADVISLKKKSKDYRRKNLSIKNMGEFIKEIEVSPEIRNFNNKLLGKIKKKTLNQTIKMNMIRYFRSKNYRKRIEVYNCKKYDDADLIKFKKPIKFFYSFVFKDFKFLLRDHEQKRSIFYVDNLIRRLKPLETEES